MKQCYELDLYLWNDTPVIEEGAWRLLVPNNYAKKYKTIRDPVVVHRCPLDSRQNDYVFRETTMKNNPWCNNCGEWVPDNIQGVYLLHQFDEMAV